MTRKIIKVDMDCTIFDLAKYCVDKYNDEYMDNVTDYYSCYWFSQCKKANREYFEQMLNQQNLFYRLPPIKEMVGMVNKLGETHKIIFVTKPHKTNQFSIEGKVSSLRQHFPNMEYDIMFTSDKHLIKADFIIDDDLTYLLHPEETAVPICYGEYGWNAECPGKRYTAAWEIYEKIII